MIYEIVTGASAALVLLALPNLESYVMTRDALKLPGNTAKGFRSGMKADPKPWYCRPFMYPGVNLALKNYEGK